MSLKEIFEHAKSNMYYDVIGKYKTHIDNASKNDPMNDVILFYKTKFFSEKNSLFSFKNKPCDKYHFIVDFNNTLSGLKGNGESFDEKILSAKRLIMEKYTNHDYINAVEHFFKQGTESIVQKLAHFNAYCEIETIFNLPVDSIKKQLKSKIPKPTASFSGNFESIEYQELFRSDKHRTTAGKVIREHCLDENNEWIFFENQKQSVPVLIKFLREHGYLKEI
jgi:hypothetical protein